MRIIDLTGIANGYVGIDFMIEDIPDKTSNKKIENFELFETELLSLRPEWQKAVDWLKDHSSLAMTIAIFGSPILFIPTIFVVFALNWNINAQKEIKDTVKTMKESWGDRHQKKNRFLNSSFIMGKFPAWMRAMIEERRDALCRIREQEIEDAKPPAKKDAENILRSLLGIPGISNFFHRESFTIEDTGLITYKSKNYANLHDFSVWMKYVFNLDLIENTKAQSISFMYGTIDLNEINQIYEKTKIFVNAKESIHQLIEEIKQITPKDITLENAILNYLKLDTGKDNELILHASVLQNETVYESYKIEAFAENQTNRQDYCKNLRQFLNEQIGPNNFTFEYQLESEVKPKLHSPTEHETNYPFCFDLRIKANLFFPKNSDLSPIQKDHNIGDDAVEIGSHSRRNST